MTESQTRKAVEEAGATWHDFLHWMCCQTVGIDKNGNTDFYNWDVQRFIRLHKDGRNEGVDEWD